MQTHQSSQAAFSLIEMVMVLALIALLATLAVINLANVHDTADIRPTDEILAMAVREARYQALLEKETVFLSYNATSGAFEVRTVVGRLLAELRTDHDPGSYPVAVTFRIPLPPRGMPGSTRPFRDLETREVERVAFGPNLAANPFLVELTEPAGRQLIRFDPFSNVRLRDHESSL